MRCAQCGSDNRSDGCFCQSCGAVLENGPNSPVVGSLLKEAEAKRAAGDTEGALSALEQLAAAAPGDPRINTQLGVTYQQCGRQPEAVAAFMAAVRATPHVASAYYNLGIACRSSGLINESIESFTAALKLQPAYTKATRALSEVTQARAALLRELSVELVAAGARGDDQAVSQLCSRLLHLDDRNLQATVATAKLYRKRQMLPEALHWCRIACCSFPQASLFAQICAELEPWYGAKADAIGLVDVAETSLQQKEYADAARYASAAVKKDPGSSRALLVLALGEEGTERLDEARKHLQQLAEMEDSDVVATSLKRVKRKQQAAARKASGHLLAQAEKDRVADRADAALAGLAGAAECFAEDPLLYALTALCLRDLQRYPEAIATAIRGLECDPDHKRCRSVLTQVRRDYDADLERRITDQLAAMAASCKEKNLQAAATTGVAVASLLADRRNNLDALCLLTNEQPGVDPVLTQELQFWLLSGTRAELSKQFPEALDWYGKVFAVLPNSSLARKRAEVTRAKQAQCVKHHISVVKESRLSGDADGAFAAAKAAVAADPRSVLALVQLARLFEARKEFGKALELYERATEVRPEDATLEQRIEGCRERQSKHRLAQAQKVGEKVANVAIRAAMGRMF